MVFYATFDLHSFAVSLTDNVLFDFLFLYIFLS